MASKGLSAGAGSVIGGGIAAGSSLLGGIMGMFDSKANREHQEKMWQKNYDAQKEFYQNSIQWRTADAKAAGIHPLAALGNMGASYTPTASYDSGGSEMGQAISQAGAQIGMAMQQQALLRSEAETRKANAEALDKELDTRKKELSLASKSLGQNDDVLASISKGLAGLAEIQKSQHQLFQDRSAGYTSLYGNRQGLNKDMMDAASESLFGIGALPDVVSGVIDTYRDKSNEILDRAYDAGIGKYVELNTQRNFSNLGRPSYNVMPSSDYYKAPKAIQKKVDAFIRSFKNY